MQRIDKIAASTFRQIVSHVNDLYVAVFGTNSAGSVEANDYMLIEKGGFTDNIRKVPVDAMVDYISIGGATDNALTEWTQGKDYEPLIITRDSEGRVTTMTVKWPDESSGNYTATDYNATHEVYDGFFVTHADSGKTVTQSAVTRNAEGAVIIKPALSVA